MNCCVWSVRLVALALKGLTKPRCIHPTQLLKKNYAKESLKTWGEGWECVQVWSSGNLSGKLNLLHATIQPIANVIFIHSNIP